MACTSAWVRHLGALGGIIRVCNLNSDKHMRQLSLLIVLACTAILSSTAQSRTLTEATETLCSKMRQCGEAELAKQELPPEMRQAMQGMFSGMCQAMIAPYLISTKDAGLEDKATACLDSFVDKSCEDLMENRASETEECEEFQAAAEAAYPEGLPQN